jgi:N-carbamoyl-L-amino-acid hydrolase
VAGEPVIEALRRLQAIGRTPEGTTRLPWTDELAQAEAWFGEQADTAGLRVERDPAGSLWAVPAAEAPWWGVGSHLDSVRRGGAWDGALGVAAAFEVARRASKPVCVIAFADEEGARFNTPTFGSRALVGRLPPDVLDRRDADGARLGDVIGAEDPFAAPSWLPRLRGFLEVHIDQSREAASLGVPFTRVRDLAARRRLRFDVTGRADHAGTTPMDEREDALALAARMIATATEPREGLRVTATRILVEPNALSTIPSRATFWLDVRGGEAPIDGGVVESASDGVAFDAAVRAALGDAPEVTCWAGHDAGILAERIPAGMLLVRNQTGISHAPQEHVADEDALAATEALLEAIEVLA